MIATLLVALALSGQTSACDTQAPATYEVKAETPGMLIGWFQPVSKAPDGSTVPVHGFTIDWNGNPLEITIGSTPAENVAAPVGSPCADGRQEYRTPIFFGAGTHRLKVDSYNVVNGVRQYGGTPVPITVTATTTQTAQTITVNAGGDFQAALQQANPGDTVVLQAGATFRGSFVLPSKPDGAPIVVKSSGDLPHRRVMPSDVGAMPTIVSGSADAAISGTGAQNWTLDGLRFEANASGLNAVLSFQDAQHITLDRLLFVAPPDVGQRRFVTFNGQHMTLARSHCAGVWSFTGQDSQCVAMWDGAGPYTITDNLLEAASENVLVGGADSQSAERMPSDITIAGNLFTKDLAWKGKPRGVKNILELKAARNVVIRDNTFERNWSDAQKGTAIVFTVRNQDGTAPWSEVRNVLFERNIVRDTEGVFNILGYDDIQPSGRVTDVTIRDVLAIGTGVFLEAGGEVGNVTIDHVTADNGYTFLKLYKGGIRPNGPWRPAEYAIESLTVANTLAYHNEYGVWGEDASGLGLPALQSLTKGYVWRQVALAGGPSVPYPPETLRPTVVEHKAQFNPDYSLTSSSSYRTVATDGGNLGSSQTWTPPFIPPTCDLRLTVEAWPTKNQKTAARFTILGASLDDVLMAFRFVGNRSVSATASKKDGTCSVTVTR